MPNKRKAIKSSPESKGEEKRENSLPEKDNTPVQQASKEGKDLESLNNINSSKRRYYSRNGHGNYRGL